MPLYRAAAALTGLLAAASSLAAPAAPQPGPEAAAVRARAAAALEADASLTSHPEAILIRFKPGTDEASKGVVRGIASASKLRDLPLVSGLEQVRTDLPLQTALARIRAFPQVQYAEPDYVVRPAVTANDEFFGLQWGIINTGQNINGTVGIAGADIRGTQAWDVSTGDPNFVIAVIDTGAQVNHPDLQANIWVNPAETANGADDDGNGLVDDINGWNFYDGNGNVNDLEGHGTHTAGTVGAVGNNGIGVAGVNWQCKIMVLKFLGPNGGFTSDAVAAVQYCTAHGVKVSNNSWGGGGYSQALYDAISASRSVGHVFVAAAGNGGFDQVGDNNDSVPFYPSSYTLDNIIAVAATNNRDGRGGFSNYGASAVDLGAPGVDIASTYINSGYAWNSGTSMASPHVAGVAALVYAANPSWTYTQVRSRILSTVRPVNSMANITTTGGVLDAAAALGTPAGNTAPSVTIAAPSGGTFLQGASITFSGSASDAQDGNLSGGLVWTSSLQGQIGTGPSFSRSDLILGTHTITASVTDSGGLNGSRTVTITITNPTATPPAAPSGVSGSSPSRGTARITWTDNSSNETGFEIQRETRIGNGYGQTTTLGPTGANVTVFAESVPAGRYRYRVRAVNAAGASAWTGWVTIRVR